MTASSLRRAFNTLIGAATICATLPCLAQQAYVPDRDDVVLEHVVRASAASDSSASLRRLQTALAADPNNADKAVDFAHHAIVLGNAEGDPRYFGYAESAIAPWWKQPKPPAEIRLVRATILQWRHDFDAALRDLDSVIADDQLGVDQAHLTRAIVLLVQGDPAAARHDCAELIGHTDLLTAATCIAAASSLQGQAPRMEKSLSEILQQDKSSPISARLWALTELAEIAVRLGHDELAARSYETALQAMQSAAHRDPYLLASYSDFLLDHDQPAKVLSLWTGLERIDNLLLRMALAEDALARAGDADAASASEKLQQQLQQRFDETRARGDFVHQREEAMYLLHLRHEPAQALSVAAENWQKQREPTDARILLEAAIAAHRSDAAAPVLDWIKRTGIEDVRLQALSAQLAPAAHS